MLVLAVLVWSFAASTTVHLRAGQTLFFASEDRSLGRKCPDNATVPLLAFAKLSGCAVAGSGCVAKHFQFADTQVQLWLDGPCTFHASLIEEQLGRLITFWGPAKLNQTLPETYDALLLVAPFVAMFSPATADVATCNLDAAMATDVSSTCNTDCSQCSSGFAIFGVGSGVCQFLDLTPDEGVWTFGVGWSPEAVQCSK